MKSLKKLLVVFGCITIISSSTPIQTYANINTNPHTPTITTEPLLQDTISLNLISSITANSLLRLKPNTISSKSLPLIEDSTSVNYKSYIPKLKTSTKIKEALDIKNPDLSISATSAILFNVKTGKVLYYKDPVSAVFPASTAKLLSSLVAVDWCKPDEKITVGNEIKLIASDSSKANLRQGETLTTSTLLRALLLPSGNDAAYVMATYVGRKSLGKPKAKNLDAVKEFVRLMNEKAEKLGAENSCFITPDGYDALGQYTTAYDMGMIALAAVKSKTILNTTSKCVSTNTLISGEKYTWNNSNLLIKKGSPYYYCNAVGLKTGTTTMAGKCLLSAAKDGNTTVVSIVMNSTSNGRWNDSLKLLKYGINKVKQHNEISEE